MNRVIGNPEGYFGDKHDELVRSTALITEAGAYVPTTIGISQDVIDQVLDASGLPGIVEADSTSKDMWNGRSIQNDLVLPSEVEDELQTAATSLVADFGGPLILRSSGSGDSIGIGVYESKMLHATKEGLRQAFSVVVGSYFTERAIHYRERAGVDTGFGMFLQPVVGDHLKAINEWAYGDNDRWLDVFTAPVSGNVKIGTPRNPQGVLRLNSGLGSAVNNRLAPAVKLGSKNDEYSLDLFLSEHNIMHRNGWRSDEDSRGLFLVENKGVWEPIEEPRQYGRLDYMGDTTVARIKTIAQKLRESLGAACYFEFATVGQGADERTFVLQLATLEQRDESRDISLDEVKGEDILVDDFRVLGGEVNSPVCPRIVCMGDPDSHSGIYWFDQTEEAKGGYILVYPASVNLKRLDYRLDIGRLKNVKALIELEDKSYGHKSGTPEEHLVGYTDQLGIPLLNLEDEGGNAWVKLNGAVFLGNGKTTGNRDEHGLIIRDGSFRVMIDQTVGRAAVVKV